MNKLMRRSFTLVEVITALAIMGFVMLIIGVAVSSFYRTWSVTVQETERLKNYQKIDVVMDTLVRNMIPFNWKKSDDRNETQSDLLFDGQYDSLMFTSLRRSYSKDSGGLIFVRLRLDDDKLLAEYSQYPRYPWLSKDDSSMPWKQEVLIDKVKKISFLYADKDTDYVISWEDTWDREKKKYLPLAVRMTLEFENGQEESWLRRTAGSGSNSVYLDRENLSKNVQ